MKVIYRSSKLLKEMDDAIDTVSEGSIERFELDSKEYHEFLILHKQGAKGIIKFQPESWGAKTPHPGFTYRGIGVIMV